MKIRSLLVIGLSFLMAALSVHAASKKPVDTGKTKEEINKEFQEIKKELNAITAKLGQLRSSDAQMDETKRLPREDRDKLLAEIKEDYRRAANYTTEFDDNQKYSLHVAFKRLNTEITNIKSAPGATLMEQAGDMMTNGKYREAAALYDKAEAAAPKESDEAAEAAFYIGWANEVQGGHPAAISAWEKVQKRYPKSKWAATSLAYIIRFHEQSAGTRSVAEKEKLQMLRDYPDSPEAAAIRQAAEDAKRGTNAPPQQAEAEAPAPEPEPAPAATPDPSAPAEDPPPPPP